MANLNLSATLELVDKISAPLQGLLIQTERLERAFDSSTRQVEQFERSLAQINRGGLNQLNTPLQRTNSTFTTIRQNVRGLASDVKLVFGALTAVHKKADNLAKSFANTRKELRQQAVGSMMKMGGTAMLGYQMLQPAIAFDKQMSATQAVLELSKGSAELEMLRNQAISEGARSAFSATQAAQAQYELGAAGFTTKQVYDSLGGTLDLAAAGQLEVSRAAEIAGGILNGFGMEAGQVGKLGDVMVATANKTSVSIEDLGESMKITAPVAKMFGATVEQTHAMIGLLGNVGIKGTDAGTGVKAILARLATLPKPAMKALDKIKINPVNKDGTMKDVGDLLNEIRIKTQHLSADERMDIFKGLAGQEHFSKLEPLIASTGVLDEKTGKVVNKFKELTEQLKNSDGLAKKVADIQMDNLAGDIDQLKGAWESLSITLGGENGVMNASLRQLVQTITDMINKVTDWAKANPELVKTIGSLALKFIKLNVALWSIKYGFALVFGTFFSMLAGFIKFGAVMMITNAILAKFGLGFGKRLRLMAQGAMMFGKYFSQAFVFLAKNSIPFVITALRTLSVALVTTPIGWAIMAIAVAGLLIIKYWQPVKAFFSGLWQGFLQGLAPLMTAINQVKFILATTFAPLKPVLDMVVAGIQWLAGAFMWLITPAQTSKAQLDSFRNSGSQVGFVLGTLVSLIGQVVAGLVGALALGFQMVGTAIGTFVAMVQAHGGAVLAYMASFPARMLAFFAGLPSQMMAIGGHIIDGLKNGIMGRVGSVLSSIQSVASRIKSAFTSAMSIHSPSRVFAGYGDFIMQGLHNGLMANDSPISAMTATSNQLKQALDTSQIHFGKSSPITAQSLATGTATQATAPININIYPTPNQSPSDIASLVAQEIAKMGLGKQTNNTALYDHAQMW
ncbi:phage tail tape measure protein [Faucicola boevrei]|uniref:phage tail tape measure protein n=1 Tax=Faucicola boevrei TaxID=346665 RepID=UPI00037A21DD|nr:phage tail tape measure protein [Moraxella boevrei]